MRKLKQRVCLVLAIACFIISMVLLAIIFFGCGYRSYQPNCLDRAYHHALTLQGLPWVEDIKIATGDNHGQAIVKVNGKWRWVTQDWVPLDIGSEFLKDYWFDVSGALSIEQARRIIEKRNRRRTNENRKH